MATRSGRIRTTLFGAALLVLAAQTALANETVDAAIGGGVGGAVGGAVGHELGGKQGAVIGAAAGAALGAAVTTEDDSHGAHDSEYHRHHDDDHEHRHHDRDHHHSDRGRFCPPGQAKKGNC